MKKYRIHAFWWRTQPNYGDLLGPYIVSKLTGKKVVHAFAITRNNFPYLIKLLLSFHFQETFRSLFCRKLLFPIGSVLSWGNHISDYWGVGFYNSTDSFHGGNVYAVRGKLSADKLLAENGVVCNVFGDTGMLMPLVFKPSITKRYKLGIIPHWTESDYFLKEFSGIGHVINLVADDVESVTAEIASCEYVLSTSLHGIIIAHSYNVPAIWMNYRGACCDGFKFRDYLSITGIDDYSPFESSDILSFLLEDGVEAFFTRYIELALPRNDLSAIRKSLLLSAPFDIEKRYYLVD